MSKRAKLKKFESSVDYKDLGRMIENLYLSGAVNKKQLIKNSFLKGLAAGFGGVLGATVLITLLLWILSQFDNTPFIGPIFESLERTIDK